MRKSILAVLGGMALLAAPLYAQRTTGAIVGTVRDPSGAVLPGTVVSLTGATVVGTQTATSNADGFYRFINLPPGTYDLSYALSGFRTVTRRGLRINVGTNILLQKRGTFGRLPDVSLLDVRLQKDFRVGEKVRFSVFADALNLLNEDAYEGVQSTIVTSSVFDWPFDPVDPRRVMLGAKLRF